MSGKTKTASDGAKTQGVKEGLHSKPAAKSGTEFKTAPRNLAGPHLAGPVESGYDRRADPGLMLKTKYKFIHFEQAGSGWSLRNSKTKDVMGYVAYYSPWRQYVVEFSKLNYVFNNQCLRDTADFMDQLNKKKGGFRQAI